jgi:hypothetical protein
MTNTEATTAVLADTHRAVLRYLVDAESTSEHTPRVEAGNRGLEGTAPYATLRAMERRGLVTMRRRAQAAVGAPAVSFWTAELTEAGRDALAVQDAEACEGGATGCTGAVEAEHVDTPYPYCRPCRVAAAGDAAGDAPVQGPWQMLYEPVVAEAPNSSRPGVLVDRSLGVFGTEVEALAAIGRYVLGRDVLDRTGMVDMLAADFPPALSGPPPSRPCPACGTIRGSGCAVCRPDSVLGG